MSKSRIREWAEWARRDGLSGQIMEQVIKDEDFEENVLEGLELIAGRISGEIRPELEELIKDVEKLDRERPEESMAMGFLRKRKAGMSPGSGVSGAGSNVLKAHWTEDHAQNAHVTGGQNAHVTSGSSAGSGKAIEQEESMQEGVEEENQEFVVGKNLSEETSSEAVMTEGTSNEAVITEATTSDFPDLVGEDSAVKRQLIKGRKYAVSSWRKFSRIVPLNNMKTVTRLRRSDTDRYLPVAEGSEHEQGGFSEYKVTYAPKKYERGVNFTWEMFVNDDMGAFRNIGIELGRASENTAADFVVGLIRDNGVIYDGVELFHVDHGNVGTDALSEASLGAAITSMKHQLSEKGNPLMIRPGYLLVPPELEFTAKKLIRSTLVPGSGNNDVNVLKGIVEVVVEPLLTDANNWYVVAKPSSVATIEVGFLGGRQSPEVMVEEGFDRDVIKYKGRIVFGGAVMDYRGFYGGIVG